MKNRVEIIDGKIYCPKCKQYKGTSEFYIEKGNGIRKDRYKRPCKECRCKSQIIFYEDNIDDKKIYMDARYQKNRETILAKNAKREIEEKGILLEIRREYRRKNREEINRKARVHRRKRIDKDIAFRLRLLMSSAIVRGIKMSNGVNNKNNQSFLKYIAYTMNELREHLEKQFEPWMNWNNLGVYRINSWDDNDSSTWAWNIDHIIPHSKLPYISMEDDNFKICWSLDNLRPLSAKQNVIDGNRR